MTKREKVVTNPNPQAETDALFCRESPEFDVVEGLLLLLLFVVEEGLLLFVYLTIEN